MTGLEIMLTIACAVLAGGLVSVWTLLLITRRRLAAVKERLRRDSPRPRRLAVPTAGDAVRTVVGTVVGIADKGLSGTLRSSIDDLARWADVERPDLARMAARDGTVTILFSDIEGSTALNHELGDRGWVRLLERHDAVLHKAVRTHGGHVVKTQGDGFMVAFADVNEAVAAAVDVQRRIARARPGSRLGGVRVRIGVHRGPAVHRGGDLFGRNVAYAARVADLAAGGEVLVSDAALTALESHREEDPEAAEIVVVDSREAELKGVPGTQVVHNLAWEV